LIDFRGVALYLNVSEAVARSLAEQGVLPGHSAGDRWEVDPHELEEWFVGLSGQDWADLVSDGKVDPISMQLDLGNSINTASLCTVLQKWNNTGVADILAHRAEADGTIVVELKLREPKKPASVYRQFIETGNVELSEEESGVSEVLHFVRSNMALAANCELIMAAETIFISLSPNGMLQLEITRDFREMPQRDRGLISYYLRTYGYRLEQDLKQG